LADYDLTKLGKGLMPTFKKLLTWGTKLLASR
jgi:DNA-binding HxlR family transcriptional regulator